MYVIYFIFHWKKLAESAEPQRLRSRQSRHRQHRQKQEIERIKWTESAFTESAEAGDRDKRIDSRHRQNRQRLEIEIRE